MTMPPSEMTNAEIGFAFDELVIELRSLTEEAAQRLANDPEAKLNQQLNRAYRAGSHMLASLENIKRPNGTV